MLPRLIFGGRFDFFGLITDLWVRGITIAELHTGSYQKMSPSMISIGNNYEILITNELSFS